MTDIQEIRTAISVVIIAKNEEDNLPRLLRSVNWADEVIVADTGSTDNSRAIAEQYGAQVISLSWEGFGRTKQRAVEAAKHDWILSLDADEEVSNELKTRLVLLREKLSLGNAYRITRISRYLGKEIRWCGWQNDAPLRLFNRREAQFNDKQVHEGVKTKADVHLLKEKINHYTYPQIADHWEKINFYTGLNVKEKYKSRRHYSICGAILQGIWKFILMYLLRQGFRDGKAGFVLCCNSAIGQYIKYIKLWEKRQHDLAH